jgi:Zn-dependent M28 family amino/carboxypeptidase
MIRGHTRFLASDALEGRAPGTRGAMIAASYIAAQFEAAGLSPAAPDGSYFQRIPLLAVAPDPSVIVGVGRQTVALSYPDDYVARPSWADSSLTVDADIVFVGYGIQAPAWAWDDYKGTPLTGKILLMLANDPGLTDSSRFRGRTMTYYASWTYKLEQAARLGAVGVFLVHPQETAIITWSAIQNTWTAEQVTMAQRPPQTLRFAAWITEQAARRLVDLTGKDFDLMVRRAQLRDFRPIALGAHGAIHIRSRVRSIEGLNVVARLDGADARGSNEAVLLMAHYDHLGIGRPVDGDSIYNGAHDNASGVGTLLASAAGLARAGTTPYRSVIFLATTGAEAGSLGARAYIANPATPLELTAAALNIDRANLRGRTGDAVALGREMSTLDTYFAQAARMEELSVADDPDPSSGMFYRSDHLAFARAGVPVLYLRRGTDLADPPWQGRAGERDFLDGRFHQPGDEFSPDLKFTGAVQQARLFIRLAWQLATTPGFPTWDQESEFRPAGERLRLRRPRVGR